MPDAWDKLVDEEAEKRMDQDDVARVALANAETNGIVFLDEIDKIAVSDVRGGSVSREGVQRDLLPLIEGTTVATKYGPMKTDHVLFIASGAFHVAKPRDMLPELQGRLPIRVELKALTEEDFVRILSETRANLVEQYKALLGTEKVTLEIHRRRDPRDRQDRRAGQRKRREHRRAPAADGDGEAARGAELRGRGPPGRDGDGRRRLCPREAGRAGQGQRPVEVYPLRSRWRGCVPGRFGQGSPHVHPARRQADLPPATGKDDRAFCDRVSEALEQGWRLYGSPAIAWVWRTG